MIVRLREVATPFGAPLSVALSGEPHSSERPDLVVAAGFVSLDELRDRFNLVASGDDIGEVGESISEWLEGDTHALDDVAVNQPGTDFQRQVWAAVSQIPVGEPWTYGQVADAVGKPGAARAVGTACGANAVAPFVPCHRVIPASGGVGQYGYGSALKSRILEWEAGL